MTTKEPPKYWFWSHDIEQSNIKSLVTPGTRLVRLSNYRFGGKQRYAAIIYSEAGSATHYHFDLSSKDVLDISHQQHIISIAADTHDGVVKFSLVTEENVKSTSALKIDLDEAALKMLVNDKQSIRDLATYTLHGKRLFAAVVEPHSVRSSLLTGVTASELNQQLNKLKAAPVRVRGYDANGKRLYTAVAEAADAKNKTWWYTDLTADEVARKLEDHKAYPVDLDVMDYSDKVRFTVVMRTGG